MRGTCIKELLPEDRELGWRRSMQNEAPENRRLRSEGNSRSEVRRTAVV